MSTFVDDMENIPELIKKYASENGFNAVRSIGRREGLEAFSRLC